MAVDFENTAAETVMQLQELMNRADQASEDLSTARERLAQVSSEFDSNWTSLAEEGQRAY